MVGWSESSITPEGVRTEVNRFWNLFVSKAPELLEEFYTPNASVFASSAIRSEPGRLAVARRRREYFEKQTAVKVQVGPVDVELIGGVAAIASYTFRFDALHVASATGKQSDEHLEHGRATQVFVLDGDGKLRIAHEHLSGPFNPQ